MHFKGLERNWRRLPPEAGPFDAQTMRGSAEKTGYQDGPFGAPSNAKVERIIRFSFGG